jgi:predicted NAD/FAD-binding protein
MRVAIIGSGISGLVAAHLIHGRHEITAFEAATHIGGHARTLQTEVGGQAVGVDTGFVVFNRRTYPRFSHLIYQLGIGTQPADMSFSVQNEPWNIEYQGASLGGLFAQRRNIARPAFLLMLRDYFRFGHEARTLINAANSVTLAEVLQEHDFSQAFLDLYLRPMGAAIWSADPQQFLLYPAAALVQFFKHHGLLGIRGKPTWRSVLGGASRYVAALLHPFADRVHTDTAVTRVERLADCVTVATSSSGPVTFDRVIIAVHADQALRMLADPSCAEHEILSAFPYRSNEAVLHTDPRMLPRRRNAWAAWNYHVPTDPVRAPTVTYEMSRLQKLDVSEPVCLTLNRSAEVSPDLVHQHLAFEHPVYTTAAFEAQARRHEISGTRHTAYCGAYWGYGFHEDGVASAEQAVKALGLTT